MSNIRKETIQQIITENGSRVEKQRNYKISAIFGSKVFDRKKMKEYLNSSDYESVIEATEKYQNLDRKTANSVASAMQAWAIHNGATHFTHWFQPLTGSSAEKHDSFYKIDSHGEPLENFSGDELVQQEPDASSFPSGGIRSTFEARGYTAWDPSSPAFIVGKSLCIPSIFISYTTDALDFKTPLLRSSAALDKVATVTSQFFNRDVNKVYSTLGWEQEYFLIDSRLFSLRPDFLMAGRTLFGHIPAKGQQMEDHYFGSIPDRIRAFMDDFEEEAHKLGIPVRTKHNEVAPAQFECAPIFEESNTAVDHNVLLMDIMSKIAIKHNFKCIFHEKPFRGLNGSGKHCNWSMSTDTGINLLGPGKTPKTNLRFLTFFINVIKAVHDYSDLLRATVASAENDHRMGANEAPPAIISVFIGKTLSKVMDEIENRVNDKKMTPMEKTTLKLEIIGKIPEIMIDNTDRNRTSPFAFTGNKFEFRAVGGSMNTSGAITILNTIMAKQLDQFNKDVNEYQEKNQNIDKDEVILHILKQYIKESKKIIFDGNGYSEEWAKEAESRGLSNVKNTPDALKFFLTPNVQKLFEDTKVLTKNEIHSRYEILLEKFTKTLQIESRTIGEVITNIIIPAAINYQTRLLQNTNLMKETIGSGWEKSAQYQLDILKEISERVIKLRSYVVDMINERKIGNKLGKIENQAKHYDIKVKPYFDKMRYEIDKLEFIIDDEIWPLPKDRELLFIR